MRSMLFGVLLIVGGILYILSSVLGINLPVFRILLGVFVVYYGIKIITGGWNWDVKTVSNDHKAVFAESKFTFPNSNSSNEFTTVFGESELDLTAHGEELIGKKIKYVTVFGEGEIILKKDLPVRIMSETVLGNTSVLEKGSAVVGKYTYQSPGLKDMDPALEIEVVTVFGQVKVKAQD